MSHLLQVFTFELQRNFRRRAYLFATFLLPLLGYIVLTLVSGLSASPVSSPEAVSSVLQEIDLEGIERAGVVDQTGTFTVPEELSEVFTLYPDVASANAAMTSGAIEGYYLYPADYVESGEVTLVLPSFNLGTINSGPARAFALGNLAAGVDEGVYQRLVNPANITVTNLSLNEDSNAAGEDARFIIVYIFAIVLLLSLFMTNGYLMQSVIEEKETRLVEILLSTMRPIHLLAGKILAMGVLGLFQLVAWVAAILLITRFSSAQQLLGTASGILAAIANISIPLDVLPYVLLYFVFAYVMFASFYAAIGALSTNMREGPQYAVILVLPAIIPVQFLPVFADDPNGTFAVVLSMFPLTSPLGMVQRLVVSPVPGWQIALSLLLLALAAVAAMWVAGRLFRANSLLAGQMPKLRDIPKLIRG
jgi:ABC-2 type transport system permease protein